MHQEPTKTETQWHLRHCQIRHTGISVADAPLLIDAYRRRLAIDLNAVLGPSHHGERGASTLPIYHPVLHRRPTGAIDVEFALSRRLGIQDDHGDRLRRRVHDADAVSVARLPDQTAGKGQRRDCKHRSDRESSAHGATVARASAAAWPSSGAFRRRRPTGGSEGDPRHRPAGPSTGASGPVSSRYAFDQADA